MNRVVYISMKPSSSRCSSKNFRDIGDDMPIYRLAFDKATELYSSGEVDEVRVVSSDVFVKNLIPVEFTFIHNQPENESGFEINTLNYAFNDLEPEDVVLKISVVNPFISLEAMRECLSRCVKTGKSVLVVSELKKLYYTSDMKPINFENPFRGHTQINPCIYEYTGTIAMPKKMFETAFKEPEFVFIPNLDALDIDTEEDFWLAKAIYEKRRREE